ncbi:MAG: DUF3106 domain-containing protein [Azonexus sp.]|nr:DUF3106 domain-containing protein [Azonexus sp.]
MRMFAWRRMAHLLLVLSAFSAAAGAVHAQMPPDQRRQMRQEMREQWRPMPQDDRQRFREDRREQWRPMPQDDRKRMRDEMRGYAPPPTYGGGGGGRGQRGGWR